MRTISCLDYSTGKVHVFRTDKTDKQIEDTIADILHKAGISISNSYYMVTKTTDFDVTYHNKLV